jgi:prepilin-type N-terminal cleavage/methylation domain-containing protein
MQKVKKIAGFTLMELMVVITILGIMSFFVIPRLSAIRGAPLKKTSADLARNIKYIYNKSMMQNKKYRIVYDFESSGIYTEFEEEKKEEKEDEKEEEETQEEEKYLITGKFVLDNDFSIKKLRLPDNIKFNGIYTSHNDKITKEGKDYTMIMPNGFVEKTIIYLEDNFNRIYTLTISPMTGALKIYNEYIDEEAIEW